MNNLETSETIPALLLDDERTALDSARRNFSKVNILIEPSFRIEEFQKKEQNFRLIISDLDLKNISRTTNGINVLVKIRSQNKSAFLVLYSAFLSSLTEEQWSIIEENNIQHYDKKDGVSAKNIRLDYEAFIKTKEETKNELIKIHYDVNKNLALNHLNNISSGKTLIPLLKVKKLFTVNDMIKEIEADSEIGSLFILQYLDTVSFINSKKNKL